MWYTGLDCMIHTKTVVLDVAIMFMILLQNRPEIWIVQQPFIAAVTLNFLLRLWTSCIAHSIATLTCSQRVKCKPLHAHRFYCLETTQVSLFLKSMPKRKGIEWSLKAWISVSRRLQKYLNVLTQRCWLNLTLLLTLQSKWCFTLLEQSKKSDSSKSTSKEERKEAGAKVSPRTMKLVTRLNRSQAIIGSEHGKNRV